MGIEKRKFETEDPVISLPAPCWIYPVGDDPYSDIASLLMFGSEAKQVISEFRRKLGKIESDIEALHCKKCGGVVEIRE